MLYLKSLVLDRFKSFKHAELLFNNGFTCVVGPNGSGKSNICDALFFGLGEASLRRIRVKKLNDLIMLGQKKRAGTLPKAYIRAVFSGDEDITVLRAVRADGKALFKVNGKKTTRQEVKEILKKHNIRIDETSTIAQGEIQVISDMTSKERRELIDIAAGIQEFEVKKAEALKELEKASIKVNEANIMLHERGAFLGELEKEKEAAERYIALSARQRTLNYSILFSRKNAAQESLESYAKEMAVLDARSGALQSSTDELNKKIEKLSTDRMAITKEIAEGSQNAGETSKKLEDTNRELATISVELDSLAKETDAGNVAMKGAKEEIKRAKETVETNVKKIEETAKTLEELRKKLDDSKLGAELGHEAAERRLKELTEQAGDLETKLGTVQGRIGELNTEITLCKSKKEATDKALEKAESAVEQARKTLTENGKRKTKLSSDGKDRQSEASNVEEQLDKISKDISANDERSLELREQKSMVRENATIEKVRAEFSEKDGFLGRAGELCTYKPEHAIAVETAAGSRFDYLVVDTISTAGKMIDYLKRNDLGRLTFIPIKELRSDVESAEENGLTPAISMVKFDPKFKKVFGYILGNTYIITDVEDAKKHGVGKRRYVTSTGELVEQSGIVSGGSTKKRLSIASIDAQLSAIVKQKQSLRTEQESLTNRLSQLRKEQATIEIEMETLRKEAERLNEEVDGLETEVKNRNSETAQLKSRITDAEKEIITLDKEKLECMDKLANVKAETNRLVTESVETGRRMEKVSKAEREKVRKLNDEATKLQVDNATLVKESEMLNQRITENEAILKKSKESIDAAKKAMNEKRVRSEVLEKAREEIEAEIKSSSASTKKAFEKQSVIDEEIAKHSRAKGKMEAELDALNRQTGDIKVKRGQAEVRFNDITIELATYKDQRVEALKDKVEEMERELAIVGPKINELGSVNLKAPEIYEQKKKDVDEVASKVATLEAERQAVLNMIEEINSKKYETFMATFNTVNKNFSKLYAYFSPLPATIELDDAIDPLSGGLEIKIKNGNNYKRVDSMSGGEKAQILLSLIFAIHLCKPSSLYIFDEVDASLDKENSKKLSLLIKDMSKDAQFVVVSHNDSLIVNADTAIGVVKVDGDSKAVGLEISNYIGKK